MRTVRRQVAAPAELGTELIGIPAGADLELDLRLESVMEGVLVSGLVRGPLAGQCVRCLEDLESELEVDLQELFVYPERAEQDDDDDQRRHAAHAFAARGCGIADSDHGFVLRTLRRGTGHRDSRCAP